MPLTAHPAPRLSQSRPAFRSPAASPHLARRAAHVLGRVVVTAIALLAGGALGVLIVAGPGSRGRRERAARCRKCRRRGRIWLAAASVLAVVCCVGAGIRVAQAESAIPQCRVAGSITSGEAVSPPTLVSPQSPWFRLRGVLTGPESGLAAGYAELRAKPMCNTQVPDLTVALVPEARLTGGSTVGDVFLTSVRSDLAPDHAAALARHESRHADQWAVLTVFGGIAALPLAYGVDQSIWPGSQNHFEQSAGLAGGGYPAPGPGSTPRLWVAYLWLALVLIANQRRIRYAARRLVGARSALPCGLHRR